MGESIPCLANNDAALSRCWRDGNQLVLADVSDDFPSCDRCGRSDVDFPKGSPCYVCTCQQFHCCAQCFNGALILPSHLQYTAEGEELKQAWSSAGRDEHQLVWYPDRPKK